MKMHLKMTLYHKLVIAENVFIEKTKTEAHSTEFKVTLDKMVSFWSTVQYSGNKHTWKGKTLPTQHNTN